MNGYLRQSTASQSRLIGPFVDDTDFKTAKTALTIANTDIKLRANGTTLANKNSGGGTHQVNGMYSLTFDATDTANVGELFFVVVVAGALPVFGSYVVVEEAVYDALFAASAPGYVADQPVNATKIGGTTQTGRDIAASVLLSPGTGTGQVDLSSGKVLLQPTQTGVTIPTVTTITNDVGITQTGADKVWASATRTLSSFGSLVADIATAVWGAATRVLTAGTNISLAKGTGVTGFNDVSAATVRTQADDALLAYDGPTHAELTSALAGVDNTAVLTAIAALDSSLVVRRGTAQGITPFTTNTIILDAGASTETQYYSKNIILITAGTGAGQVRRIVQYNAIEQIATVDNFWTTQPDNTSEFVILPEADIGNVNGNINGDLNGNVSAEAAETIANRVWEDDNSTRTNADTAGNKLRQALILYEGN